MRIEGNHKSVFEYDGAFHCFDCGRRWGAFPGNPVMPNVCKEKPEPKPDTPQGIEQDYTQAGMKPEPKPDIWDFLDDGCSGELVIVRAIQRGRLLEKRVEKLREAIASIARQAPDHEVPNCNDSEDDQIRMWMKLSQKRRKIAQDALAEDDKAERSGV